MSAGELLTTAPNQWCPGCGNFGILNNIQSVLEELGADGLSPEKVVVVAGIGQHAKMADYLNVNSFYSLHGRGFPVATAIKLADPEVCVVCFAGDGDAYAEGLDHLIFAAKRNIDITAIIHDNRVYGLTTGQYTPTSPLGYKGKSTPAGTIERPFNPLEIVLASGATFVARGYPTRAEHFKNLVKDAIKHRGFSLIDVLQVCVSYSDLYDFYNKHVYEAQVADPGNFEEASQIIRAWDYNSEGPIPIGKFYEIDRPGFEGFFTGHEQRKADRDAKLQEVLFRLI
jgi:2-oxoglutarate ferredoxin oxidoreductase subunit beta